MASPSNRERVGRSLQLVNQGLTAWADDVLIRKFGTDWRSGSIAREARSSLGEAASDHLELNICSVILQEWDEFFSARLSAEEGRRLAALAEVWKEWDQGGRFTDDAAERTLSDAEHMLRAVSATRLADEADALRRDLRRVRFEKDQKRYLEAAEQGLTVSLAAAGLPPWREVVQPHDDVAQGTYQLAEFAADLRQVRLGIARPEYADPEQFFARTFVTRGLRYLLTQTLKRVNGVGGEPVIDLMTTFGGGKTHSEIAVFHLTGGTQPESMPGVMELCEAADVPGIPAVVSRAVVVGNDLSVLGETRPDGTEIRTMWGEIAHQLGGKAGYAQVEKFDLTGAPPPTTVLAQLLSDYAPCVILIDEWVAYLRQLYSRGDDNPYPAGSFGNHQTFVQSLTEAVKSVDKALLVASLPASDSVRDMGEGVIENAYEIGGTPGLEALRSLRSVIHRVETPWQPASVEESYEIVRRRLFKPLTGELAGARDLVVSKFIDFYVRHAGALPSEALQPGYAAVLRAAYPIHPETFERLYQDWSTLERFQRTRGVLRLMATVVHALWARGDTSTVILPASIPLDDIKVFEEITSHLDDPWKPVVDTDIAGINSTAEAIDREIPLLGKSMAAKRVARALFFGTAPAVNRNARRGDTGPVRGLDQKRVVLGCTYPGDNPAHLQDALRQLGDRGAYMNRDQDRYWLSLQQTVSRIVQDRAESYDVAEVRAELVRVLRDETDRGVFLRVHRAPDSSADVDDEPTAGLVILGLDRPHSRKASSLAEATVREFLDRRGGQPRIHKNSLLFVAPDLDRIDTLEEVLRRRMAWASVKASARELNLDQHNVTLVESRLAQASQAVTDTIRQTYRWILNPHQGLGQSEIEIETILLDGDGTLAGRVSRKAETAEFVISQYAPALLRSQIDRLKLWDGQDFVELETLASYFTQYLYMPRITSHEVIRTAVGNLGGVLLPDEDGFAYADDLDSTSGRFRGLTLQTAPATVSMRGLIVSPTVARRQLEQGAAPERGRERDRDTADSGDAKGPDTGGAVGALPLMRATRFHAAKALDSSRAVRDMSQVAEEILTIFSALEAPISVTVDLESSALARLSPEQLTVLRENLVALGFSDWSIE